MIILGQARALEFVPELQVGATEERWSTRRGFLELMDTMPQALKMDFVPYIEALFPAMLMGINGDKDMGEDPGHRASLALVQRFGDLCPELLLTALEGSFCAALHAASAEERERQLVLREKVAVLIGKVAEKILEHKKFGQDLLTTDECSTREVRQRLLVLIFLTRSDSSTDVKRVANGIWKNVGGAPKLQKAILPAVEKMLLRLRGGEFGPGAQKLAADVYKNLAGELEPPAGEPAAAGPFLFPPKPQPKAGEIAEIVQGRAPGAAEAGASEERAKLDHRHAVGVLSKHAGFAALPECLREHAATVAESVTREVVFILCVCCSFAVSYYSLLFVIIHYYSFITMCYYYCYCYYHYYYYYYY